MTALGGNAAVVRNKKIMRLAVYPPNQRTGFLFLTSAIPI